MCYIIYNNNNSHKRDEFIQKGAITGLDAEHVKRCLVIARNMDDNDVNYNYIGLME